MPGFPERLPGCRCGGAQGFRKMERDDGLLEGADPLPYGRDARDAGRGNGARAHAQHGSERDRSPAGGGRCGGTFGSLRRMVGQVHGRFRFGQSRLLPAFQFYLSRSNRRGGRCLSGHALLCPARSPCGGDDCYRQYLYSASLGDRAIAGSDLFRDSGHQRSTGRGGQRFVRPAGGSCPDRGHAHGCQRDCQWLRGFRAGHDAP